ncbi:DJ-1/PfpI family protein [Candidatus Nomurabacteria bacterium]|nr:DJ-1/PfpI family protein [Candidatus Nomurabacteria bacterium]
MKKVALIVAGEGFQSKEYLPIKEQLEAAGVVVVTVSDVSRQATDNEGRGYPVDLVLSAVEALAFDGVFWIGGSGTLEHLDNQESNRIANECMLLQKFYGAICIAPRILAKAHVMTGKKATGWNGDNALAQIYAENNVEYIAKPVVVDEYLITADGPGSAQRFGKAIADVFAAKV